MSNHRQCRAFLIDAFLALDENTPEDERLRRAIEHVLEAVARTELATRRSNIVQFPKTSNPVDDTPVRKPGA